MEFQWNFGLLVDGIVGVKMIRMFDRVGGVLVLALSLVVRERVGVDVVDGGLRGR